jgi:DNA replication protein DnaC
MTTPSDGEPPNIVASYLSGNFVPAETCKCQIPCARFRDCPHPPAREKRHQIERVKQASAAKAKRALDLLPVGFKDAVDRGKLEDVATHDAAMAEAYGRHLVICLAGPTGTGKTRTACCLAHRYFIDHAAEFEFISWSEFVSQSTESARDSSESRLVARLADSPVLVIDDLGSGRATPVTGSVLTALIKRRIDQAKVTIITSQYSMAEALSGVAKKQDSDAIARRISEKGAVYVFQRHCQE